MTRSFHEPVDPFDLFDREKAQEIVADREERRRQHEERVKREDEQAERQRQAATRRSFQINARQLVAEYAAAGVSPPRVDFDGVPTVSLSMLLSLGWRVECVSGENKLVEPPPIPARRRSSNAEQGS